jgi:hypothetical protein
VLVSKDDARPGIGDDLPEQWGWVGELEGKEGPPRLQGGQARDHVLDATLHVDPDKLVGPDPKATKMARE